MSDMPSPADQPALPRTLAEWSIVGIFWIMLFAVLTIAQSLMVPVISAVFLALVCSPVRRAMGRMGIPAPVAAAIIFAGVASLVILLANSAAATAFSRIAEAPAFIDDVLSRIEDMTGSFDSMKQAGDKIGALGAETGKPVFVVREPGFFSALQHATPIVLGQIAIALTLALFLISSGDLFYEKLVQVMPALRDKRRALAIARDIENQLSVYLLTIILINAATGAAIGLAMWAIGMPDPVLFALAAFILDFIPYFGALVGVGGTFLIALVVFDTPAAAFWPPLAYYLLNTIEGQVITPVIVGRRLQLNAVVVFAAFAFWAWIWSFMGMLLAMPILLSLKVISDHVPGMAGLGTFLADRDELSRADQRIMTFVFRKRRPPPMPASAVSAPPASETAAAAEPSTT